MGSDIFDLCDTFTILASVSLVENDRFPLLKELSEIKDFDERVECAKSGGTVLEKVLPVQLSNTLIRQF